MAREKELTTTSEDLHSSITLELSNYNLVSCYYSMSLIISQSLLLLVKIQYFYLHRSRWKYYLQYCVSWLRGVS
jgi:hypothetical protein